MTAQETSPSFRVRAAESGDAESIASIYNFYIDAGGSTFDTNHWPASYIRKQLQLPSPDAWFVAISDHDRSVFGWSAAHRFSGRHGYRHSLESAIYLRPDVLGRGVGDVLQQRLDTHCAASDIHHLVAKIIARNGRSIAFHRRHGFEIVGTQREVGNIAGKWIDVTIMQKVYDTKRASGPMVTGD